MHGRYNIGGLVGYHEESSTANSYATGAVTGTNDVGGLVGRISFGSVENSGWAIDGNISGLGHNDYGTWLNNTGESKAEINQKIQALELN